MLAYVYVYAITPLSSYAGMIVERMGDRKWVRYGSLGFLRLFSYCCFYLGFLVVGGDLVTL